VATEESEFLAVQRDVEEASRTRESRPTGWEPRLVVEGDRADLVSRPVAGSEPAPGWEDELRERGGDPSRWMPSGPVRYSSWDAQVKGGRVVMMQAYRWNLVPVEQARDEDVDALIREVSRRKRRPPETTGSGRSMIVAVADWQAGKGEGGGHEGLIERIESLRVALPERLRQLRRAGRPVDRLYLVSMGDLVEGCGNGHYAMQDFSVTLDRRQQVKLVRRLLYRLIADWAPLFPEVVVGCVPGNHGENRRDGRAFTRFEDNDDLAVVEQVGEIVATSDAYSHVRFVIPDGDMTLTLEVADGVVASFAHGHQARKGASPQARIASWWKDKAVARHPVGDADLLITGHYHHLTLVEDGPRTWVQCPANDGGSRWFEESGGATTRCGTLTLTVDADGWADLAILR
jgi:hypothetical protein